MSNTLIAEFMGAVVGKKIVAFPDIKLEDNLGIISNNRSFEDLHYHSSWDWLMPVVEKIENFGYEFIIVESRCYVKHNTDHSIEEVFHMEGDVCSKLKTTYEAVVEFINQYNKNIIW